MTDFSLSLLFSIIASPHSLFSNSPLGAFLLVCDWTEISKKFVNHKDLLKQLVPTSAQIPKVLTSTKCFLCSKVSIYCWKLSCHQFLYLEAPSVSDISVKLTIEPSVLVFCLNRSSWNGWIWIVFIIFISIWSLAPGVNSKQEIWHHDVTHQTHLVMMRWNLMSQFQCLPHLCRT